MYNRMLVPLDGSKLAEVVFPYATEVAGRLGLDVVLLHVYQPEQREMERMHRAYIEHAAQMIQQQAQQVRGREGISPETIEAQGEVAEGHPADEILRYAEENDIDIILMATHGRSGIKRWALGSVANKVLRASNVPVWLIRAGMPKAETAEKRPRSRILVPLDSSELAEVVLPHAEALAKQRGPELVEVVLLTVCEPPFIPSDYPPTAPLTWEEHVERETTKARNTCSLYLVDVEQRLKDAGLNVRTEVLLGKPADEIIEYANENPFSLIVMATHGRSGVSRWAFGSVAEKVLLGVSTPVFLVRPHYPDSD